MNNQNENQGVVKTAFCSGCGQELSEGQLYCPYCGKKVQEVMITNENSDDAVKQKSDQKKKVNWRKCFSTDAILVTFLCALAVYVVGWSPVCMRYADDAHYSMPLAIWLPVTALLIVIVVWQWMVFRNASRVRPSKKTLTIIGILCAAGMLVASCAYIIYTLSLSVFFAIGRVSIPLVLIGLLVVLILNAKNRYILQKLCDENGVLHKTRAVLVTILALLLVAALIVGNIISQSFYDHYLRPSHSVYSYSSTTSSSSSSQGTMSHDTYCRLYVKISGVTVTHSGNYAYCRGKVTNNGSYDVRYVKVKAVAKDRSGNIVDTDWTYAVDSSWLSPGESKSFEMMIRDESKKITTCDVTILTD